MSFVSSVYIKIGWSIKNGTRQRRLFLADLFLPKKVRFAHCQGASRGHFDQTLLTFIYLWYCLRRGASSTEKSFLQPTVQIAMKKRPD